MLLLGMLDSPFVRRVAVSLQHYGLPFARQAPSTWGDFEAVLARSPLGKVPALVLEDGTALVDSSYILDHLDGLVGPALALTPPQADLAARLAVQRIVAVALGLAEKSVEYRTETARRRPDQQVPELVARITRQIGAALDWLEAAAARAPGPFLCGAALTQADVTAAIAVTNLARKDPALLDAPRRPALVAHAARCEALPAFTAAPFLAG